MKKRTVNIKKVNAELNSAFSAKAMTRNLSKANLYKSESKLKAYAKSKAKDSAIDSSTLAMRFR